MKIGIVLYPTYGGSGVVATELGMALAKKGHEIHFITYSLPFRLDDFGENIFYHEVRVTDYPLFYYKPYELVLTSKLVDVVKHEGLELLHVHYAIPHASAAYMAKQILEQENIHIPYITTLHGTDITLVGKDSSFEPVITFAINQSDAVTAVSKDLKKDTHTYFNINRQIEVIPNFINPDHYDVPPSEVLKKRYSPNGERIIVHISNFRKVKRVQDVAYFFAKFLEKMPAKLILVGDGPERHNIEEICRKQGTCKHTEFLGKLKAIDQILSIADLFILTSETESFGLSALEAMVSSVPVISTNTGGLPEVIDHGNSGYLSNVGDIDDMVENAYTILKDDESLHKFRKGAKKQALNFHIDKVLPLYEELYERVVSKTMIKKEN